MKEEKEQSGIIIRDFQINDYAALIKLWKDSKLPYKANGRDSREKIEKELGGDNAIFLVAELDGEIVGSVFGTHDGRKGWINRLAVSPEFQKEGTGRILVTEVEKRLSKSGIGITACLIENWNTGSMKVFEKLGYTKHRDIIYFTKREDPDI